MPALISRRCCLIFAGSGLIRERARLALWNLRSIAIRFIGLSAAHSTFRPEVSSPFQVSKVFAYL